MSHRQTLFTLLLLVIFISACDFSNDISPTAAASPTREIKILQTQPAVPSTATPVVLEPTATPTPATPEYYTVESGDTLAEITKRFGLDLYGLARANHLTNINLIYAGQQLLIASIPITIPKATVLEGKQILVILSEQKTYVYEDGLLLKEFIVSTGVAAFPTVTGSYAIYIKLESTRMTGPGYDLTDVPWTMYFFKGYGFHGTYWHSNFGTPMSHGCINMYTPDADWLYHWAEVGTPVLILP